MSIALVVKTVAASTDNSTVTSSAIDTTGADLLLVFLSGTFDTSGPPTDSKGNTWHALTQQVVMFGEQGTWYYAENPVVGSGHTFSWTPAAGTAPSIGIMAFSGAATATVFNKESGNTTFGTTIQPGSLTPDVNNCVVVQAISFNTAGIDSINESYNFAGDATDYLNRGANNMGLAMAYKIQTTPTATNPTWTANTATSIVACAAVFKPGGTAGRLARPCSLEGLGGAGQQAFNPNLGV